jgi:DnaJ-class molecular chaperone
MQPKQYYRRLSLWSNATKAEIRATYKILALQQHPDKAINSDREKATKNFQQLQEA